MEVGYRTVAEWEGLVGEQVRNARIAKEFDQKRLSQVANVSVGAISSLERGSGSSLKTLVAVIRALDRTDWLESLAPSPSISPLQALRAKEGLPRKRVRVRRSKPASP